MTREIDWDLVEAILLKIQAEGVPFTIVAPRYDPEQEVTAIEVLDAKARKAIPLFSGCFNYFPDALLAVSELSRIGNEQHNPGTPLHWDRSKSGDELDALARHLMDVDIRDSDGVWHATKVAWRALANLQKHIEKHGP